MLLNKNTHNQTAMNKKTELTEYLEMMQVNVQATTVESHGHTVGIIGHVMRSYCTSCKASCDTCYQHDSQDTSALSGQGTIKYKTR